MTYVVQFAKSDGQIVGIWQAMPETLLTPQAASASETLGYTTMDSDLEAATLLADYAWHDGLVAKARLTLVADPIVFPADGVSECQVRVVPFVPCTLLVGGQAEVLTEEDPVLVLTADTPQTMTITLAPQGQYTAQALSVEAR